MSYDTADDVFVECEPDDLGPNFITASWDAVAIRPLGRSETHLVEEKPDGYLFHAVDVSDILAGMTEEPTHEVERVFVPIGTTGAELRQILRPNGRADLHWLPEKVQGGYEYVRVEV